MKPVIWILRIIIALAFFVSANVKLASFAEAATQFANWGYPVWWLYLVAAVELLGAVGVLIPKTTRIAASALLVLMLGAIYTSFSFGDSLVAAVPAIVLLVLLSMLLLLQRGHEMATSL